MWLKAILRRVAFNLGKIILFNKGFFYFLKKLALCKSLIFFKNRLMY
ncbi:hypothetical protein HMPREF1579_00546 [Gardnerella vaginalis JCP8066]|nr:hypothetical protein HMPREF1579_00546 [Gardnerella vaginalis JCP8066]